MFELKSLLLLLFFLLIEISSLLLILIALIQQRIIAYFTSKTKARRKAEISEKIVFYLENAKPFVFDRRFKYSQTLLSVLESFNNLFQGGEWNDLKIQIVKRCLIQKARKKAASWLWGNRNFAARVFALAPFPEDESMILTLLQDPVFLVKSPAAVAAIALDSKIGVDHTLQYMAQKSGYARYYFRDILLQGSAKTFAHIADIALETKDTSLHLACLEVLAGKTVTCNLSFLEQDLQSKNPQILLAALKVLARNPLKTVKEIFLTALQHPDPQIRAEAAAELKSYDGSETIHKLEEILKDPIWWVRLNAALSLREMGEEGIQILKNQDPKNKIAYEVAKYALDFLD